MSHSTENRKVSSSKKPVSNAITLSSRLVSGLTESALGEMDFVSQSLKTIFAQAQQKFHWVEPGDIIVVTDKPHEVFARKVIRDRSYRQLVIDLLASYCSRINFDSFAAPEAKGWPLAGALANLLNKNLILLRKLKKTKKRGTSRSFLPYQYHYGDAKLVFSKEIELNERIIIIDDDLITGGTACACIKVISQVGGIVVGLAFAIEWLGSGGRAKLENRNIFSALKAWRIS